MASLVDFYKSKLAGVGQKLTNILDRDKETPGFQITKNPVLFSRSTSEGGYKPSLALQAAGGLQNFAENKLTNIPKFTPLSSRVEKIKNPVTRFIAGVPAGFVEGVANIPGDLLSGSALVGREIGKGFDPTRNIDASQLIKGGARLGESFLNATTLGVGKQLAEQAGKQTLKSVLKEGAKSGAKYGAAYGALGGLQDTSGGVKGQLLGAGTGAVTGAAMGAAGGAVLGGGMYGIGRGVEAIAARRAAANAARNKLIDEMPRLIKPEPNWERKVNLYYQEHGEPIFNVKKDLSLQDVNKIYELKNKPNLSGVDAQEIKSIFTKRLDSSNRDTFTPEFMLKELSLHADNTGIKPGFVNVNEFIPGEKSLSFGGKYDRGDISKLTTKLDDLLGTDSYITSDKWQAKEQARKTAKRALEDAASQGDELAKNYLSEVNRLEDDIIKAQGARPTKSLKQVYSEKLSSPTETSITPTEVGEAPLNIVKPNKELPSVLPTQPSAVSENSLAPIISKKGKLNLERLAVDDTSKQALQDINQGIPTSVISNKSVIEKAKTAKGAGRPMSDEQMQNLLAQQLKNRQQVVDLSAKFSKAKAEGASEEELGKIMLELANQSRTAQQGGTFAGRLLQAQNIIADQSASPMQKILALLDNAGIKEEKYLKDAVQVDWNNPVKVVEFYRKYVPPKLGEVLTEIRYTNMLSSPLTHITNIASNALQTGFVAPIEKSITGVVDSFRSALTGKEREYYARAGIDYTRGYIGALPEAVKKASNVLSGKEISIRPDMEYLPTGVGGPLQKYTTPLRALEAMDQFFKTLVSGGVTKELQSGPKKLSVTQIASQAEKEANYRLFRQAFDPKGELGQGYVLRTFDAWNSAINGLRRLPGGKWVLPFLQTPTNILKQGLEYSPLGVSTMVGAQRPIEQLSKAIIGTGVFATAYQLASSGLTSWEAPSGEKERELYYAAGLQPYSVKIGNKWVSFSKLGPLSYPIAMAAALADAEKTKPDQGKLKAIGNSIGGMLGFFGDQSYVRSIGDLVDAIQGGINVGPSAISSQASNLVGQLIPYKSFLTWLGRIVDPTYRKATTFTQKLVKDIPILGGQAEPYLTPTGEPSKRDLPIVNAISPFRVTVEKGQNIPSYRKYEQKRIERGIEKRADEAFQQGKTTQTGKVYRYVDDAGSVKKVDIAKYSSMPSVTNYDRALKETEKWKLVDDVLNLEPQDQASALKDLGVTKEDAVYYKVASADSSAKYAYIKDQAQGVSNYQEFLTKTLPLFREVNGKKVFTDTVVDQLYDEGIITSAQKKQLKSIDYSGAKPKLKSGTTKVKYVKAVLPKSTLSSLPKVKRIRTKRYKLVVPKAK